MCAEKKMPQGYQIKRTYIKQSFHFKNTEKKNNNVNMTTISVCDTLIIIAIHKALSSIFTQQYLTMA